jgi:hypothetical protein
MNEQLFTQYAEVCVRLKELEEVKKKIGEQVSEHMRELKAQKIQSPVGTFSFAERVTWKYTDEVAMAKEEMEAIMEEEQKNGKATAETTQFLRFQSSKTSKE